MSAMAKEVGDKEFKEEHLKLAAIIKGVHNLLRREYKANSHELEQVWQKHTQNHSSLHVYADAMHRLATEHWTVYPETRIDWCKQTAIEYFHQNGLRVALQKDAKRQFHELLRAKEKGSLSQQFQDVSPASTGVNTVSTESSSVKCGAPQAENLHGDACRGHISDAPRIDEDHNEAMIGLALTSKIRLLDVGSCYNPFLGFDEFDVLSIDLSPAKQVAASSVVYEIVCDGSGVCASSVVVLNILKTVLQCDFLELSTPTQPPPFKPLDFDLQTLRSPLQELPGCSFHVVVFSLLLEYLPSASQRWECCMKAHSLLAVNGLLLVVTPDSHSQHRNAPMMRCWKQAIESLGFQRWKYEKKDHIHCMAFRKVPWKPNLTEATLADGTHTTSARDMLYIPQDFSGACYDNVDTGQATHSESCEDSEDFVKLTMEELPMFGFEDS